MTHLKLVFLGFSAALSWEMRVLSVGASQENTASEAIVWDFALFCYFFYYLMGKHFKKRWEANMSASAASVALWLCSSCGLPRSRQQRAKQGWVSPLNGGTWGRDIICNAQAQAKNRLFYSCRWYLWQDFRRKDEHCKGTWWFGGLSKSRNPGVHAARADGIPQTLSFLVVWCLLIGDWLSFIGNWTSAMLVFACNVHEIYRSNLTPKLTRDPWTVYWRSPSKTVRMSIAPQQ